MRLSSPALSALHSIFVRSAIWTLLPQRDHASDKPLEFSLLLADLHRWRDVLSSPNSGDETDIGPLCHLLCQILSSEKGLEFEHCLAILKRIAANTPEELASIFAPSDKSRPRNSFEDFIKALNSSEEMLKDWMHRNAKTSEQLGDRTSDGSLATFLSEENDSSEKVAKLRSAKRRDRLEQWHMEQLEIFHALTEYDVSARTWTDNINASENFKSQRHRQDQQESNDYIKSLYRMHQKTLQRLNLQNEPPCPTKWQLDECEGRERMRLRLAPLQDSVKFQYEPRRIRSQRAATLSASMSPSNRSRSSSLRKSPVPNNTSEETPQLLKRQDSAALFADSASTGGEYEIVPNPAREDEDEDKNRKVMRSLERGEKVLNVYNVSRIIGLEACESLLIIGKDYLYLVDNLFQRSDGEVVNACDAPVAERDPYTRIISGNEIDPQKSLIASEAYTRKAWPWSDILSFSKRHFLTRDVAIEVFFEDGRSYLLTGRDPKSRNLLHTDLLRQTESARSKFADDSVEQEWRPEHLTSPRDISASIGSRFVNAISPMLTDPVTRKWAKGEMSNFQYLMVINTRAGRTFNDLTQYPVFPWVLADFKSVDLDLSNPRIFRDLSKPMGCQSPDREIAFRERYASFAEMDDQTPAFHYGTHYSSAMIVTSYLIRLQPFVHSNVLLQGGSFDHADRIFNSIERAWMSSSKETFSDVRELTPEFYYLPDFLKNVNRFNFGVKDGTGETVDDVILPPWAKGDPCKFITKHREALESPYVSQNLHSWIDLIFGFKQRGEAALESTNVFHHLSYFGSRDLDTITDPLEKAATIGIIHNFGQTPQQVFTRPHERRDADQNRTDKLLKGYNSLTRTQSPIQGSSS